MTPWTRNTYRPALPPTQMVPCRSLGYSTFLSSSLSLPPPTSNSLLSFPFLLHPHTRILDIISLLLPFLKLASPQPHRLERICGSPTLPVLGLDYFSVTTHRTPGQSPSFIFILYTFRAPVATFTGKHDAHSPLHLGITISSTPT